MRRKLLILGLLLCLGLSAVVILLLASHRPGVTRTNFDRIETGSTRADVEELLGGRPRDESPNGTNWSELHNGKLQVGHSRQVWGGDHGAAIVIFDEKGRVAHASWMDSPESTLDYLRRRLGWLRL